MAEFIIKYWAEALFTLIISIFGIAYKRLVVKIKENSRKQEAIENGIQALLKVRIIETYNHYIEKSYLPIYARENINTLYEQYKKLGGNGTLKGLMEKLHELPTEK